MPRQVSDGIWDIELTIKPSPVNTYEWESETETLLIYSAETAEYWNPLLKKHFPSANVKVIPALHSKSEIDATLSLIQASGGIIDRESRVATAIPAKDGSQIMIGIEATGGAATRSAVDIAGLFEIDIPLVVEKAPEVTPADRNASGASTYWLGGNAMRTNSTSSNSYYICSTGFQIGKLNGSDTGMLSADHCGSGKPYTDCGYSRSTPSTTNALGNFNGVVSSVSGLTPDTALWTGGKIDSKFIPAIYTGSYTDVAKGEYIRGGNYPAVGTDVCYTGSQSGNVCNNEVLYQGLLICYSAFQCYGGMSWTSQRDSVEAAGNGDSGGPVYQMVNGMAYASGVVSGIVGGSSTCTGEPGEPGGRQCSPVALFAPVAAALGSGSGWGLSYIPPL